MSTPPEIGQAWEWPADDTPGYERGRRRSMVTEVEDDPHYPDAWGVRFADDEHLVRRALDADSLNERAGVRMSRPWPPRGATLIGTLVMESPTALPPQHDPVVRALLAHSAIGSVTLIAENPTRESATVNGFDMPPYSVAYAVTTRDGPLLLEDRQGVAQTICNKLAMGIATVGPEFEDVTTSDGRVTAIRFTIWETT